MIQHSTEDNRGQVGIGTLIVFISMVLVAAIAAGVLINTAGFLSSHAEATGEESTQQVSNHVQVISTTGETFSSDTFEDSDFQDTPSDNDIVMARLVVQTSPGADAIDLSEVTIDYLADEAVTLTHEGGEGDNPGELTTNESFLTEEVEGESGSDVLIEEGDRSALLIPLGNTVNDGTHPYVGDTADPLEHPGVITEGDEVEVTITTGHGSSTRVVLRPPEIIYDESSVGL